MLNKEKMEQLMEILGELTQEQKAILTEALKNPSSDKELFEKLGGVDKAKFEKYIKAHSAEMEEEVMEQTLSLDELAQVAGGGDPSDVNCTIHVYGRNIYQGGFPNCASGVEDGSWCGQNDACYNISVIYKFMNDCDKAWH